MEASTGTERPDLINKIGKRIRFIIIIIIIIIMITGIIAISTLLCHASLLSGTEIQITIKRSSSWATNYIAIVIRFRRKKKEKIKTENRAKKALKTISLILGAFVTCWTPYHILAIVRLTHCHNISIHHQHHHNHDLHLHLNLDDHPHHQNHFQLVLPLLHQCAYLHALLLPLLCKQVMMKMIREG